MMIFKIILKCNKHRLNNNKTQYIVFNITRLKHNTKLKVFIDKEMVIKVSHPFFSKLK